jgi:hypothetical protein
VKRTELLLVLAMGLEESDESKGSHEQECIWLHHLTTRSKK